MICKNCGHEMNDNDIFCENCGHKYEREVDESKNSKSELNSETVNENNDDVFDPYDNLHSLNNEEEKNTLESEETDDIQTIENVDVKKTGSQFYSSDSGDVSVVTNEISENSSIKTIKINKKALTAICVTLAILIGGTFGGVKIYNSVPIKIDMSNYISSRIITDSDFEENGDYDYDYDEEFFSTNPVGAGLIVSGYNEYADIVSPFPSIIDWDSLVSDVDAKLQKKKKVNGRKLNFYDFIDVNENPFEYSISSNDIDESELQNVENGDELSITIHGFSATSNGISIEFLSATKDYSIEGLKVVKAFDPFQYVNMVIWNPVNGKAGIEAKVESRLHEKIESAPEFVVSYYDDKTISVSKDDSTIAKISFYFSEYDSSRSDYKNGDSVYMYYDIDNLSLTEDYDLYIVREEKECVIDNLGEYATMSTKFTKEQLKKFKKYAISQLKDDLDEDEYNTLNYETAYFVDLKDKNSSSNIYNSLCLVYSFEYQWFDETEVKYAVVKFNNIIIDHDKSIPFEPDIYYSSIYGNYSEKDYYVNSYISDDYNVTEIN